jgi:hypothetical protein
MNRACVLLLIPLALLLWTGNRGIDFGRHWDQSLILNNIQTSLRTRILLPTGTCNYERPGLAGGNYEYPSLLYWIGMGMTVPQTLHDGVDLATRQPTDFVNSKLFTIRFRQACLAISSLSIVWVFFLGKRVTGHWLGGFLAACFLAGSWEFTYHARWIAPDVIMSQFAAMCLLLCIAACGFADRTALGSKEDDSAEPNHLIREAASGKKILLAAAIAGLATGTKYPAGLLILPVLTAGWFARPRNSGWLWLAKLIVIQLIVFLITTPGAILQPWNFFAWLKFNQYHYGTLGHFGHTILNHTAHLLAMLQYLSLVLFSHYAQIAAMIAVFSVLGVIAVFRRSWRVGVILLPFPILYVAFFSQQIVMIVRNLMVLAPFLAVFAAAGVVMIFDLLRRLPGRAGVAAATLFIVVVCAAIAANFGWLIYASSSMTERHTTAWQVNQASAYLSNHSDLRVFPSDAAAAALALPIIPARSTAPNHDVILAFAQEDTDQNNMWCWPANLRDLTLTTFGPEEVNFNYYPNWMDNRLVLLDVDQARRVPVAQIERAVRRHDVAESLSPDEKLLAYLNCGSVPEITASGITIKAIDGTSYPCARDVGIPQPDAITIQADNHQVDYQIAGMDPKKTYRVGWSWWDWNTGHRYESTWAVASDGTSSQLQGPTRLPAWPLMVDPQPHKLAAEWLPKAHYRTGVATTNSQSAIVPQQAYRDGQFRFEIHKEAGPDVVITSLWIVQEASI